MSSSGGKGPFLRPFSSDFAGYSVFSLVYLFAQLNILYCPPFLPYRPDHPLNVTITWIQCLFSLAVPAKFKEKRALLSGKRGHIVKLECTAEGDNPITIHWSKDSTAITKISSHRYEIKDIIKENGASSFLTIRSVDIVDEGYYQCTAENSAGKDERSIKVTIIEPPSVPMGFSVRQTWSRSATLTWSRQTTTKAPITGYLINYWKVSAPPKNDKLFEANISSNMDSHLLNDLVPGSTYEATIVALNEVGASLSSKGLKFTTNEEEPSSPPVDIAAVARSPSIIRITWSPPIESTWNGKLSGYYIGYKQAHDSKSTHSFRSIDASQYNSSYEFSLTHLMKETPYSIVIKAFNPAGNGPESQSITVKTLFSEVPAAPRIHVLSAAVDQVVIKYSALQNNPFSLQYLRVHFKEADELHWREFSILFSEDGNSGEYTLKNLSPNTIYMVFITATNEYGDSDPSHIVRARTAGSPRASLGSKAFYESDSTQFWNYFPVIPVTIALAIVIIVIVIAYVYVRKAQIEATKPNLELCSATLPGTFGRPKSGTLHYIDDNGRSLIQTSLIEGDYQCPISHPGTLSGRQLDYPTGSKTSSKASMDSESRHVYDHPY